MGGFHRGKKPGAFPSAAATAEAGSDSGELLQADTCCSPQQAVHESVHYQSVRQLHLSASSSASTAASSKADSPGVAFSHLPFEAVAERGAEAGASDAGDSSSALVQPTNADHEASR